MKTILNRLPFFDAETTLTVRGREVVVLKYQIVFWVSLTNIEVQELPEMTPRFPAVLDTGNSHNFSLSEAHLNHWAGLVFPPLWFGNTQFNQRSVPLLK